ncbi:hypothetical protein G647_01447 [Cladophialophora carrionii CBS 160.54]|uniref:Uncharacterized protein n=1 Tax=Cladophialophora carrionii CBS 160.54 TaxID=1279043 RepID=V9DQ42_9EURO|nr:uncharacterized protein G647_01447 [Cladophialophora carrionii CBS 160.54]ETI28995.1 hypothetical protein G647_01447 [Cladophialophora carrionii CBS 160.54]
MAPIRRYLRISKYSVLECRIFLENPADEPRWLLNESNPALPRIFEAVKPYVLPKLREETERAKSKGKKKKSIKDVMPPDDFEVSIFLTEINTRHSLIIKNKTFREKAPIKSNNGNKMTGAVTIRDEDEDEGVDLGTIPAVGDPDSNDGAPVAGSGLDLDEQDDKKTLGFDTTYEGFSIWGRVLCLFVERKGPASKKQSGLQGNSQALMQDWIQSTQEQNDGDL